jgi:iron complex transport system substrate-binding protein
MVVAAGMAGLVVSAVPILAADEAPKVDAKPQRVVSINLCVDELVLRLADRRNIASVTWMSRDPKNSNVSALAREVPINHGVAEEIVPLKPDLVIAGMYTARAAVAVLRRTGFRTVDTGVPRTFDEVRQQYRELAALLGEQAKGEALVAEIDGRLAKATVEPPAKRPRAILLNPNGYTVGGGSLIDEIITRAGLENVAATLGLGEFGAMVPLEVVATSAIDVLIVSANRDGPPAMATEMLRHPVLSRLSDHTQVVVIPNRLWNCTGPDVAEAVALLAQAGRDVRRKVANQ